MMDVGVIVAPDVEEELRARDYYVHRAEPEPVIEPEPEPVPHIHWEPIPPPLPLIEIHEPHPGLPAFVSDWLLAAAYAVLCVASRERDIMLM
jgi:hypothetical protein